MQESLKKVAFYILLLICKQPPFQQYFMKRMMFSIDWILTYYLQQRYFTIYTYNNAALKMSAAFVSIRFGLI